MLSLLSRGKSENRREISRRCHGVTADIHVSWINERYAPTVDIYRAQTKGTHFGLSRITICYSSVILMFPRGCVSSRVYSRELMYRVFSQAKVERRRLRSPPRDNRKTDGVTRDVVRKSMPAGNVIFTLHAVQRGFRSFVFPSL